MLLDIRETIRNSKPLKYTLITLICIPFALVGIGSYLGGGAYQEVAEVNGTAINSAEVDSAFSRLRQNYQQMFGGNIPQGLLSDEAIRDQALDGLVTELVIVDAVEDQNFAIGDATLGRAIRDNPQFHTDGQFDSELYQNMLRGRNAVAAYEESMRAGAAVSQFRAGIESTSFQLPTETKLLESLSGQTRTVDFVRYSVDAAVENIEISDEAITEYFEDNADNYKFPERAKFEYIELKKSDLAAEIEISDEDAQSHYDQFKSDYITTPEVRETAHILLEIADPDDADAVAERSAELEAIRARILAGEDFAEVAKEVSEDIGSAQSGGSLGQLEADFLDAQYVAAASALTSTDELSDPVKTRFGVHLIKLEKLEPAVYKSFDESKDDIVSLLQNNEADTEFLDLRTAMEENVASDPETLEVAADASNVEIQQTDWIDNAPNEDPIFSNPAIMNVAFGSDVVFDQNNSDLIEIAQGHVVSIRVLEHNEPRPKTLDDVKEDITTQLKRDGAAEQLKVSAKDAVDKIRQGTPVMAVAEGDDNATATEDEVLTRTATVFDQAAIDEIYALPKPNEGKTLVKSVSLQNGDIVAYALKAVEVPAATEDSEADASAEDGAQIINPGLGQAEMAAMVSSLREKADITINE